MSLSILQRGSSNALVLLFFPSPIGGLKAKLVNALGPQPTIVIDESAKGQEDLTGILKFVQANTGISNFWTVCIGGFSAGCQRARALRIAGAEAEAFVFIDGAHAAMPPAAWQIDYLKDLVDRARRDEVTLVITHTYVVTEPAYLSTAAVARLVTGWELPLPEPGGSSIKWEGALTVYSAHSKPLDVMAHSAQANVWLPMVMEEHIRPIVETGKGPPGAPLPQTPPSPTSTGAPACRRALQDADAAWPSRRRDSDGIMGDARHQGTPSDHNVGNAVDITHDPTCCHGDTVAALAVNDGRVTYVIWNRRINSRDGRGWRAYTGANAHETHVHISIRPEAREDARPWGWSPGQANPGGVVPGKLCTEHDGWLALESEYLPRVVTRENGAAAPEALKALAIAARTYVLRAMLDDPRLGTPTRPIPNSEHFQTYAPAPTAQCLDETTATSGVVALYEHRLILANHVAGAIWMPSGLPGDDPTNTERWITYNKDKSGALVTPTALASTSRIENRGCMSHHGADWLARHGYPCGDILRYFYGADLELVDVRGSAPLPPPAPAPSRPPSPTPSSRDDGGAFLAVAGAGIAWMLQRGR